MSSDDHFIRARAIAERLARGVKVETVADALSLMDDAALVGQVLLDQATWQPIATAPTDDPEFQALACNYDDYKRCWLYYIINRHDVGGRYECWVVPPGRAVKPTYWRPLSEPPPAAPGTEAYEDLQRMRCGER